ncbi:MAG: hypothetical protein ABEN55_12175 [Bradymonadaceae bacterium]
MTDRDEGWFDDPDDETHIKVKLDPCPRCEGTHPIYLERMINSDRHAFWGKCSVANQPVLILETPDGLEDE